MSDAQRIRVLAVADGLIPSVELVLAQPLKRLRERDLLDYRLEIMRDVDPQMDLSAFDLLIIMRACGPEALALAENACASGVPMIYAIDDDFEALDPESDLGIFYNSIQGWPRLLKICAMSRQVWAFSNSLREKILPFQRRVVVPPATASVELIDSLRSGQTSKPSGMKRIGYGASRTHEADLAELTPVLQRLLDERPDLECEFVDVVPHALMGHPRVRHLEKQPNLADYYRLALDRGWDAGIAPLTRSAFNDAKTDNKYREYGSLRVPAVYADAPAYWRSVVHGYNGLIASDLDEWYAGLSRLLDNPALAQDITAAAYQDVTERYSLDAVADTYLRYMRAAHGAPVKILVFAADIPTTDIDLVRPFNALAAEGSVEWRLAPYGAGVQAQDLMWADLLVISRVHDQSAFALLREAKNVYSLPCIYSWDDDFFSIPESLGPVAAHHRQYIPVLEEILKMVDLVRASTPPLVEHSRRYNERVVQTPYGFDFSQVDGVPVTHSLEKDDVVVGFFGTVGHLRAVESLLGALYKVAEMRPNVRFEFFGPTSSALERLPRTTFIPFSPSPTEAIRKLRERQWDIGLAPLEVNEFNRAKLPTKYRDYGACHIAGIYTRVDPYEAVVAPGRTGLLVENTEQAWLEAILKLVDDADGRDRIAAQAHAHVRNKLSLEQAVDQWRAVLGSFVATSLGSDSAMDRLERRIQLLDTRLNELGMTVETLREAAKSLLRSQSEQAMPPPRVRHPIIDRVARRFNPWPVPPKPPIAPLAPKKLPEFARECLGMDVPQEQLFLSANLQDVPYLEYHVERAQSGDLLELAIGAVVPSLPGNLGVEIVSPDDRIEVHLLISTETVRANQIAVFDVGHISMTSPGWKVRFFSRQSESPLYVYEFRDSARRTPPAPIFRLRS